jgi:hypothetical protein
VTIFARGGSWCLYYREKGKVVRVSIGRDRREAERRAAEINAQLTNGAPSMFGFEKITVEALRKLWLEQHELVMVSKVLLNRSEEAAFLEACDPWQYADGQALPPLAGLSLGELAKDLRDRLAVPEAARGEVSARELTALKIDKLWREMGASNHKKFRLEFMRVARRIGRPDLSCPKLWRHQMATAMQEADVDPFARKEIIGHTRLETTGIYTHTSLAVLGQQMSKVGKMRVPVLEVVRKRLG